MPRVAVAPCAALERNREFVATVAGNAAMTFAPGTLADGFPASQKLSIAGGGRR